MDRQVFERIKAAVIEGKKAQSFGGFSEYIEPSDKIGFDWKVVLLGDVEVRREYVQRLDYDPEHDGSDYLTPIFWYEGLEVIQGLFYESNGLILQAVKNGTPKEFGDLFFEQLV